MQKFRRPILVNDYEVAVDSHLGRLCERYGVRLFPKVGLKDVVPIANSGLSDADYSYALKAHFDFVIADGDGEALLAVEFDGGRHRTDPQQVIRDDRKNRICRQFMLPLVRAGASSLKQADHRTLLEWLIELFFEGRRLKEQREEYDEHGNIDPPDYDPEDFEFNYRKAWKPAENGLDIAGPLDPFGDARALVSKFYWRLPVHHPAFEGWYGQDPRGHTVGHLALEVEPDRWLVSTGRCNLRGIRPWLDAVFPPLLAQDLALLGLARQLAAWERGIARTMRMDEVKTIVAGMEKGLFASPNLPNHREQVDRVLRVVASWGIDTSDPIVHMKVEDDLYLRYDGEDEDAYSDRMHDRQRREERKLLNDHW